MTDDRRKFKRVGEALKLKYQVIFSMGFGSDIKDGEGLAQSLDLSEGGLSFISDKNIPVDSFLEVELNLPGESVPIYIKGEVVRVEEEPTGKFDVIIKFEYKLEKDAEILHHYMMNNSID